MMLNDETIGCARQCALVTKQPAQCEMLSETPRALRCSAIP